MAQALAAGEPEGVGRVPLRAVDGLDAAAQDLGHIGALEHGQGDHRGEKGGQLAPGGKQRPHQVLPEGIGRGHPGIRGEQRDELVGEEEVKEEDDHQGRQVAHQLHVAARHQPPVEAAAGAGQGHGEPQDERQQTAPHAQPQGGQQPLDQVVGHPPPLVRVVAEQELGHGRPVPGIVEMDDDAVARVPGRAHEQGEQRRVEPAEGAESGTHGLGGEAAGRGRGSAAAHCTRCCQSVVPNQ